MPDAMPLLLNLLEQGPAGVPDFYARYYTLQVLKGLASAAPHHLQEVRRRESVLVSTGSSRRLCLGPPQVPGW